MVILWSMRSDFSGEIEWIRNFGGTGSEKAQAVISTSDGGWAVLGYTNSTDGELANKSTCRKRLLAVEI